MESNPCVPTGCKANCVYDALQDKCTTCGRSMEEIRNAYYGSNSNVRM